MRAPGSAAVAVLCHATLGGACGGATPTPKQPSAAQLGEELRNGEGATRRRALESVCRIAHAEGPEPLLALQPLLKDLAGKRDDPLHAEILDARLCAGIWDQAELQALVRDAAEPLAARLKAVSALWPHTPDGAQLLIELAGDTAAPPQIRVAAVRGLRGGCPSVAPALERLLESDEPLVRAEALDVAIGRHDAALVRRALVHPDATVRAASAAALRGLGTEAVPLLVDRLVSPVADVRRAAVADLGRLGHRAILAVPALRQATRDGDPQVRTAAQRSLREIGPSLSELGKALNAADAQTRRQTIAHIHLVTRAIGRSAAELVPELRKALHDPVLDVRAEVPRALALIGAPAAEAVPDLLKLAGGEDRLMRERVVAVLDELAVSVEDARLKTALEEALVRASRDTDSSVRSWATTGLAHLARPRVNSCEAAR